MEYNNLVVKLSEIGTYVRDTYKEKLKAGGIYATGKLYNSVGYKIEITETGVRLEFVAQDYYINIENGRKAGAKMPSIDVIRRWMISRGIPDKPGAAYLIARSIGKKGIKPKPYLRETLANIEKYKPEIREALELDIQEFVDKNIKGKIAEQINNKV